MFAGKPGQQRGISHPELLFHSDLEHSASVLGFSPSSGQGSMEGRRLREQE